ncbi:serine hydrolase domain-containing protein [Cryptosporangium arvum]|uniref:serine hydrolase domain-containing protein n=1 Tax=Cryptosporangium arvum TaxID=80871 RepID=UPI0004AE66D3|nr:serine hydrolase domain-containing protein [Cryptosporangium arvum]
MNRIIPGVDSVQPVLDRAVETLGAPGVVVEIQRRDAQWWGSAGAADTRSGRPRQSDERFRIGSATKAFTATVVLHLVGEGRVSLDDSVERWLPGLVRTDHYDGRAITVRQLLNQTSGLFNYVQDPALAANAVGDAWFAHRYDRFTPEDLVTIALSNPPTGAPGERFMYSNTNYILAALIVERITGQAFGDELERRIVRPLGLTGTYLPGNEPGIRGAHPVHYSTLFSPDPKPAIHDATEMNQTYAWSAGGLISTTGDLNRFVGALLGGRILPAAELAEMLTTVPTEGAGWIPGTRYGLGVFAQTLPCGATVWGNGGATYGSWVYSMGTRDGSHLVTAQINGDWSGLSTFNDVLEAQFCPA